MRLGFARGDGTGVHGAGGAERSEQARRGGERPRAPRVAAPDRLQQLLEARRPAPGVAGLQQGDERFGPELRAEADRIEMTQREQKFTASNPQMYVGAAIEDKLTALQQRLEGR